VIDAYDARHYFSIPLLTSVVTGCRELARFREIQIDL
jgi:hypothetical protein